MQIRFEERAQFVGQALRFFVKASANVKRFAFEKKGLFIEDSIGEVEANAVQGSEPCFDGEKVIISRGGFVAQPALDNGKNQVLPLPFEKGFAEMPKEFAASSFQDIEITRVIDMISQGTL